MAPLPFIHQENINEQEGITKILNGARKDPVIIIPSYVVSPVKKQSQTLGRRRHCYW